MADKKKVMARHMYNASNGLGMSEQKFLTCLNRIPTELLNDFVATLECIAQENGPGGFHPGVKI